MAVADLNLGYGLGTVLMVSAGLAEDQRAWSIKQERRTAIDTARLGGPSSKGPED